MFKNYINSGNFLLNKHRNAWKFLENEKKFYMYVKSFNVKKQNPL